MPLAKVLGGCSALSTHMFAAFPGQAVHAWSKRLLCQLSATCHAHMDASVAGDVLTLHSAPAQISNQLRRVDGVRQGLEDLHKDQDVKAMSVVRHASHPLFSM